MKPKKFEKIIEGEWDIFDAVALTFFIIGYVGMIVATILLSGWFVIGVLVVQIPVYLGWDYRSRERRVRYVEVRK